MGAERAIPVMDVDEFIAWALDRPGRYELEYGQVIAMSPERTRHAEAKAACYGALSAAIRAAGVACRVMPDGMTVRIARDRAYEPDALVYCGPRLPGNAVEVPAPVIVVEVLSPSTGARDVSAKLDGYFRVPSVAHYLIVDADHRALVHHARDEGDLIRTRILSGGVLRLDPPGIEVEVTGMFAEPDDRPVAE